MSLLICLSKYILLFLCIRMLKSMEKGGNTNLLVGHMVAILVDLLITLILAANNYGLCMMQSNFCLSL